MQEFLTNNTVNWNLMSLTGYRTLVILSLLMESPKSTAEINDYFFNNQYIKERFSNDTIRIYINSLRAIGCEISRADKSNNKKHVLTSHPFNYDIPKPQLKALSKLYKNIYDKIEVKDVIAIESLFEKIANLVKNEKTKDFLSSVSMLKCIDKDVLKELLVHCKNKNQIIFLYNSPKSGEKKIEIIADKLSYRSEKLYLWGHDLKRKEYSFFRADKILKVCSIKIEKDKEETPDLRVVYEVYNYNDEFTLSQDEKILEKTLDKLVIEVISKNKFSVIQRILYMADDCRVIYPEDFKAELTDKLNLMKASYG